MGQRLSIEDVQVKTTSWCNRSCAFYPSQRFEFDCVLMPRSTCERLPYELRAIPFALCVRSDFGGSRH